MESAARLVEKLWPDGKRLKPREVVSEFARHLDNELDLMREASNCSQLRRNFLDSPLLMVPEVYWDYCYSGVMVMQRVKRIPISHVADCVHRASIFHGWPELALKFFSPRCFGMDIFMLICIPVIFSSAMMAATSQSTSA